MKIGLLVFVMVLTLGGCATQDLSESDKANIIVNYINTEKLEHRSSVTSLGLDSWASLSNQYLIIKTSLANPYLVKLASPCDDLDYASTLLINSRSSSNLREGFDSVYSPENQTLKCYISEIYPLTETQNNVLISEIEPIDVDKPIKNPTVEAKKNAFKGS